MTRVNIRDSGSLSKGVTVARTGLGKEICDNVSHFISISFVLYYLDILGLCVKSKVKSIY